MRALLHKVFIDDAPLKVLSFILAVILFLVRSDWDASTVAYVRVNYIMPPDRVVTSDLVPEAKVAIRGPWSRASRFTESELDPITIDLTRQKDGELRFADDMVRLPPGLHVGGFSPPSLSLSSEPKIEKSLPVQPLIEGEPAEGYRVSRIVVTPKTVRLEGAKNVMDTLKNVQTRPLQVTSLKSPVGLTVKLATLPRFVHYLDPGEVGVRVDVERTLVERTYSDVPITVTGSSHLDDIELSPAVASVVLRGPALALNALKGTPEVVVDAATEEAKPPGTYRKRLQVVNLPPDIAAEIRPDGVHLTTLAKAAPAPGGKPASSAKPAPGARPAGGGKPASNGHK